MKVAAYQAPLGFADCMEALAAIRMQVRRCESEGVAILCCPEAILGGLADNQSDPSRFAIRVAELGNFLAPLASDTVTTIVGFTELGDAGRIYNSAAVFQRGEVAGVYRKLYPAIRRSVYSAGRAVSVFRIGELTFGIVICNDSNYGELAKLMAEQGATALCVPSNNGLPAGRACAKIAAAARRCDTTSAKENRMWVIRADVAGRAGGLVSYGASGIVDLEGTLVKSAAPMSEDLVIADIERC